MAERESVMLALNCCAADDLRTCRECPYAMTVHGIKTNSSTCVMELASDALALLKEQEPRILSLEEAEDRLGDCIHIEIKGKNVGEYRMLGELDGYSRKYRYLYVLHPGGTHCIPYSYNLINKIWRAWSARPTEEQRKAVKWDG